MAQKNVINGTVAQDMQDAHDNFTELYNQQNTNTENISINTEAIAGKQSAITGAATTIAESDLTASRVLVSTASGKVGVSPITDTELGYLDGVTSSVQGQLSTNASEISGATKNLDTDVSGNSWVLDEDDMASDSATKVPTQQSAKAYIDEQVASVVGIPSGCIVMWSGSVANIPTGWAICNGSNGTPDLTDRFVIPADADSGGTNNVGDTGGSKTISKANLPAHYHDSGTLAANSGGAHTHRVLQGGPSAGSGQYAAMVIEYTSSSYIDITESSGSHSHTTSGSTGSVGSGADYMPKYYALAFIMKL